MGSLISEISTPLVNIRGMMQVHKMEGSLIFKINDYVTGLLFVVFRVFLYPTLGYRMVRGFELLDVSIINKSLSSLSGRLPVVAASPLLVPRGPLPLHVHNPTRLARLHDQECTW